MLEDFTVTNFVGLTFPVKYVTQPHIAAAVLIRLRELDVPFYGVDTETMALPKYKHYPQAALDPHLSKIRLIQLYTGKSVVIFDLLKIGCHCNPIFKQFFNSNKFVAHNALFDMKFLMLEFNLKRIDLGCSYLMWKIIAHATRPDDAGLKASLKVLSEKILSLPIRKELQVSDWSEPELTYEQLEYAAGDPVCCYLLAEKFIEAVKNLGSLKYYKLCKAAQIPIARMELQGLGFNSVKHVELIDKWREELYLAKKKVISSTKLDKVTPHSIAAYFEEHLSKQLLGVWPRTEEGKLMCDAHTLMDFYDCDPVVKPFAEVQKKEKLTTSFGMTLQSQINPETKRLHSRYNLCGARTGRLSCSSPNIQQLPRDKEVRNLFKADNDNTLVCADYSQIELRVGAELAQDKAMLASYRKGIDLHTLTASIVGHKPIEAVTKEDRQKAKACFDGATEVLTKKGWVRFDKYRNEEVAQVTFTSNFGERYNEQAAINFVQPLGYKKFKNKALLQYKDRNVDLVCSPDHEVVFIDGQGRLRKEQICNAPIKYIPAWGKYHHGSMLPEDWVRFLVMVQADGCLKGTGRSVRFQFQKEFKILRCRALLQRLGVAYTESKVKNRDKTATVFYVSKCKRLCLQWMTVNKEISWRWLHELDGNIILDELKYWDASVLTWGRSRIQYRSTVFKTLEILQTIACLNNSHATITNKRYTGYSSNLCWTLSLRTIGFNGHRVSVKKKQLKPATVYCVQVPAGNLVIRRSKKVMISGNCNFGLMFGLGPRKFKTYAKHSYQVDISQKEAEAFIADWRTMYSGYREWQLRQPELAAKNGVVRTPMGKVRMLSQDNAYGASMNTPVQGGACECMLAALIGIQADLDLNQLKGKLCSTVHDEVLVECPEEEVPIVEEIIKEQMKAGFKFVFPEGVTRGICEVGNGKTWGEAK